MLGDALAGVEGLRRAVELGPRDAKSYEELGGALAAAGNFGESIEAFRRAVELEPKRFRHREMLYAMLQRSGQRSDAASVLADSVVFEEVPDDDLPGAISLRRAFCYWNGLAEDCSRLEQVLDTWQGMNIAPFTALQIVTSPERQKTYIERFTRAIYGGLEPLPSTGRGSGLDAGPRPLRVGYLSADYREHPVAYLLAEILEMHDRSAVQVRAYSIGPKDPGPTRARLERAADEFVSLSEVSDEAAARRIRDDGIDILVDLAGYTGGHRTGILARRAAPIQVNWLGYAATMGAPFVDYIVGDPVVTPAGADRFYSERVVRLPHCYMPYDRSRSVAPGATRAELGLPESGFVMCSFNQPYKLTPEVFGAWTEVLRQVPDAVLWLRDISAVAARNFRGILERAGVAGDRMILAPTVPSAADHLARYRHAHLAVDTFPYGSHSTAMDALWTGCPVVTLMGETFVSRVAASQLQVLGLAQLVTTTIEDYGDKILHFALHRDDLTAIRTTLADRRAQSPLFDTPAFTRDLEAAYRRMWEVHASGHEPEAFDVG